MKRTLLCLTAIALLGACKKDPATTPPDGDDTAPRPATPAAPPAPQAGRHHRQAGARSAGDRRGARAVPARQLRQGQGDAHAAGRRPQAARAAAGLGPAAGWLALAVVNPVFEDAKEPAEHAVAMGEKTGDKEVQIVAKLAMGSYQIGTEDFAARRPTSRRRTSCSPTARTPRWRWCCTAGRRSTWRSAARTRIRSPTRARSTRPPRPSSRPSAWPPPSRATRWCPPSPTRAWRPPPLQEELPRGLQAARRGPEDLHRQERRSAAHRPRQRHRRRRQLQEARAPPAAPKKAK
jgi:hypothetical protein